MFKKVGGLLTQFPNRSKAPDVMVALQVRNIAKEVIKKSLVDLPKEVPETIKASTFKNGTLTIKAPQLTVSELKMRSSGLINDINEAIGKKVIFRLRFRIS